MKAPRGFGRRYFTFASILAYSVQNSLHSAMIKTDYLLQNSLAQESNEIDENDPPLDILTPLCLRVTPSHCNSFYRLKTIIILKINHFIPRCQYYTTYFAFRRTGVHPPYFIP